MRIRRFGTPGTPRLAAAVMVAFMLAVTATAVAPAAAQTSPPSGVADAAAIRPFQIAVISIALAVLIAVTTALIVRIWRLGDRLAKLSQENADVRKTYLQMSLGVQDGTVRSAIAILIVIGALLALIAAVGQGLGLQVPEALTGVFGTILGFYFGRSGTVETSRAVETVTAAATTVAQAQTGIQAAQQAATTAQREAADAKQALTSERATQAGDLATNADELLAASTAIVAAAPQSVAAALQPTLATTKAAIDAARQSPAPAALRQAITDLQAKGPVAQFIQSAASALAPFASAGLNAMQAASALLDTGAKLPPVASQLWTARLLRAPYSHDLFEPVVDADYAKTLMARVPGTKGLLDTLSATDATITSVRFVRDLLNEDAAEMLEDRSRGALTAATIHGVIDQVQQSAVEIELSKALPADALKAFGGTSAFFAALNSVQANPNDQGVLDFLALVQKAARSAAITPTDLLPQ